MAKNSKTGLTERTGESLTNKLQGARKKLLLSD
jgi:hypothetical protein